MDLILFRIHLALGKLQRIPRTLQYPAHARRSLAGTAKSITRSVPVALA
jgi:hypothetical protein